MSGVAIAQHAATQKKDVHAAGQMILLTDKSTLIIDLFALNQTVINVLADMYTISLMLQPCQLPKDFF